MLVTKSRCASASSHRSSASARLTSTEASGVLVSRDRGRDRRAASKSAPLSPPAPPPPTPPSAPSSPAPSWRPTTAGHPPGHSCRSCRTVSLTAAAERGGASSGKPNRSLRFTPGGTKPKLQNV
eukprot:scaffold4548_cov107-Isochrysis_galbana.AAC.4